MRSGLDRRTRVALCIIAWEWASILRRRFGRTWKHVGEVDTLVPEDVNNRRAQTLHASPFIQKTLNLCQNKFIVSDCRILRQNSSSTTIFFVKIITPHSGHSCFTPSTRDGSPRPFFNILENAPLQAQNNDVNAASSSIWDGSQLPRNILVRRLTVKAQNERRSFYHEYPSFPCKVPRACTCVQNSRRPPSGLLNGY